MRIGFCSLALFALVAGCSKPDAASTTVAPPEPPVLSPIAVNLAASASAGTIVSATAAPTSSASALPAWLKLGADRTMKEHIAKGENAGCYIVKTKNGEEIDCPPMTAPAAGVDEVDLEKNHDCPDGFAASGADTCSRSCTKTTDCHGKNKCADRQCQP